MLLSAPHALAQQLTPSSSRPVQITQITATGNNQTLSREALFQQLRNAQVIYLGETHDSVIDHQAQLEIIQALHRQNPQLAIGLEMFQRPFQSVLDRYLKGELTEVELLEQSEYAQRWGFAWQMYAPIMRLGKEHQLPLIALNTPTEVTRKVARTGLSSLTTADRQFIPPVADIDLQNQAYRNQIQQIYDQFHPSAPAPNPTPAAGSPSAPPPGQPTRKPSSVNFEHFWQAQVLWDETMADRIAQFLTSRAAAGQPPRQLIVLVGQGHVIDGHGIPSRVARRLQSGRQRIPNFRQYSLLLNPDPSLRHPGSADFFWEQR
jgi:uncharacterized iron-regulated protein